MFSVILYMLRQILRRRASPLALSIIFSPYCDVSQARSYFASTIDGRLTSPLAQISRHAPVVALYCAVLSHQVNIYMLNTELLRTQAVYVFRL